MTLVLTGVSHKTARAWRDGFGVEGESKLRAFVRGVLAEALRLQVAAV